MPTGLGSLPRGLLPSKRTGVCRCGTHFETNHPTQIHCSDKCKRKLATKRYQKKHPEKVYAGSRRWSKRHPEKERAKRRRADLVRQERRYGLPEGGYQQMYDAQGGLCAICGKPETKMTTTGAVRLLCVDHDHETGLVRQLLCAACNTGLGYFKDDPEALASASAYTERWRQAQGQHYAS